MFRPILDSRSSAETYKFRITSDHHVIKPIASTYLWIVIEILSRNLRTQRPPLFKSDLPVICLHSLIEGSRIHNNSLDKLAYTPVCDVRNLDFPCAQKLFAGTLSRGRFDAVGVGKQEVRPPADLDECVWDVVLDDKVSDGEFL